MTAAQPPGLMFGGDELEYFIPAVANRKCR
jgi:hypothetical protein